MFFPDKIKHTPITDEIKRLVTELIQVLVVRFELPEPQQRQLFLTVTDERILEEILDGSLDPANLIMPIDARLFYIFTPTFKQYAAKYDGAAQRLHDYFSRNLELAREYLALHEKIRELEMTDKHDSVARSKKRIEIRAIGTALESLYDFIAGERSVMIDISTLSRTLSTYLNSDVKWLQLTARAYFSQLFLNEEKIIKDIFFMSKVDGVQQGQRMVIRYIDKDRTEHQITYYIKTHQNGSLRKGGSSLQKPDLKEPLLYKIFELTGLGPKSHFFYNPLSPSAFYIATQDESFTKSLSKIKLFQTYGQAREQLESGGGSGAGADSDPMASALDETTKLGIARTHLLLRLCDLWDIITNTGNFGFTLIDDKRKKWRVIDFRIETKPNYYRETLFDDYVTGDDTLGYFGLPATILKEVEPAERIRLAQLALTELQRGLGRQTSTERRIPLLDSITKARINLEKYLTANHAILGIDIENACRDLERYETDIRQNFQVFTKKMMTYPTHIEEDRSQSPSVM